MTESIRDYTRQAVSKHYRNLDAFLKHWNAAERKRAQQVKKRDVFTRYVEQGVESLEDMDALKVEPINQLGSPRQIMQAFGGRAKYDEALQVLEQQLYASA